MAKEEEVFVIGVGVHPFLKPKAERDDVLLWKMRVSRPTKSSWASPAIAVSQYPLIHPVY
jgi:hypothetical protein